MRIPKPLIFCETLVALICLMILVGCTEKPFIADIQETQTEQPSYIRVLLLDNVPTCELAINCPFTVSDEQTHTDLAHFDNLTRTNHVAISVTGFIIGGKLIAADRITATPDNSSAFALNGDYFRGKLTLVANISRTSFDAINTIPLESYLAGVVGAEMYNYWEPEALKAQAIAARTYCLYAKNRYGPTRTWDVVRTVASQVYRGVKAESTQVWQAVNDTAGQVLVTGTTEQSFPAYYCSACGGHTESSLSVFGEYYPTLVGVPCPYCADIAKTDRFFWPTVQFDKTSVSEKLLRKYPKLQSLGKIISISPLDQTNYGTFSRLTMVRLIGSTGASDSIRAEDLRLTIDPSGSRIKSMICKIVNTTGNWTFTSGRGYGHGVGLCQCGAEGMARQGKQAAEILSYYYPGSKIVRVN